MPSPDRVKAVETERDNSIADLLEAEARLMEAEIRAERAEEALGFYADETNHERERRVSYVAPSAVEEDRGRRAREALHPSQPKEKER